MSLLLVVDNDPAIRRLCQALFKNEDDVDVVVAENGRAGLAAMGERRPDVIIVDPQMPVMNGDDFFARLAALANRPPVLVLAAEGAEVTRARWGAEASLDKPFDIDQLASIVHRLMPEATT